MSRYIVTYSTSPILWSIFLNVNSILTVVWCLLFRNRLSRAQNPGVSIRLRRFNFSRASY